MVTSNAHTDVVMLIGEAPRSVSPMSVPELHLYAYLGCLLALLEGVPVADWGYRFTVTREGIPFSADLETARDSAVQRGVILLQERKLIERGGERFDEDFKLYCELEQSARRRAWLRAAVQCALALPVGAIRDAVNRSPGVAEGLHEGRARVLFDYDDVESLYEEFETIRKMLGVKASLMLQPAILWLSARVLRDGAAT